MSLQSTGDALETASEAAPVSPLLRAGTGTCPYINPPFHFLRFAFFPFRPFPPRGNTSATLLSPFHLGYNAPSFLINPEDLV